MNSKETTTSFNEDLNIGHRAEEYVLSELKKEFPNLKRVYGMSLHCDLKDDSGYTVEVKYDTRSRSTENVAIEYRHRGKLSGISISRAMEWVIIYFLKGTGWVYTRVKTNDLRAFLKNNQQYFQKYKGSGDKSDLILVNTTLLATHLSYKKILIPIDNV